LDTISLIIIAIGLSMDCFAVSISNGCAQIQPTQTNIIKTSLIFGIAHFVMTFSGFFVGGSFEKYVRDYDHWIAFVILTFIGGKMIYEAIFSKEADKTFNINKPAVVLMLSVATSIDALVVGMGLAFLEVSVLKASLIFSIFPIIISFIGMQTGKRLGKRIKSYAEVSGGAILILIGLKILIEHSFFAG